MKLTAKRVHLFCHRFGESTRLLKSAFPKKEQTSVFLLLLGALRKGTHFTAFYARHSIVETGYGFSMDGVPYSVLASDTKKFTTKAYSDMLGGIQLRTKSTSQE